MTGIPVDPKDMALVKREAGLAEQLADSLTIESQEDLESAAGVLSKVKASQKDIKTRKEQITKPLNAAKAAVMALFAPFEQVVDRAEVLIKDKMLKFRRADALRIAKEAAKVEVKLEKGTIKPEVAVQKLEVLQAQAPTTVRSAGGAKLQFRKVSVVTVVDELKVPRQYLQLDMVTIRRDALAGIEIPGVVVEVQEVPAAS